MIAYLDKYDTTVQVPDDISDKDMQDINENFHSYVDTSPAQSAQPQTAQPTQPASSQPEAATAPATQPKWQPNFYEAALSQVVAPLKAVGEATQSPQAEAFAGKTAEELSFGLAKPLLAMDPALTQAEKDHPAFADAGAITGGIGSLMEAGGAVRIAGLAAPAAAAGSAAVEAGFAAGERFIPRAIMTGATFGTRTFIAETVKAFEQGGVNLEQFGKDVLKDTAFGGIFGSIGGMSGTVSSVSSAGALGFISSKMSGADNREASLNAAIWAAFETVGSVGKSESLRMEALGHLKDSIGEYIGERNPEINEKDAARTASAFVDHAITKAGFDNAEDIAKSGPGNLLEGIEKVNQIVRTSRVPAAPEAQAPLLPKLPAPIEPETAVAPQSAAPVQQTPIEKAIETVKGIMGIKPEAPVEPKPPIVTGDTYEEKVQSLKDQGHDISKMPEAAFPEDMKDVYHFEQGKGQRTDMEKGLGEIAERFQTLGLKPNEGAAIFDAYGLDKKGQLGQPAPLTDLVNKPIEEQYIQAYRALAAKRSIDKGDKFDAQTMDHAQKAVDLINGYFSPKSQEIKDFTSQHSESSDHDIAQMAYDRGMIEQPNPDILKMEIQKAKQEKIITHAQIAPGSVMQRPAIPTPVAQEIATHFKESSSEIVNIVAPSKAAPLATQITREQLGKMARSYDMAEAALTEAHDLFEKQPKEKNLQFIDNLERGKSQSTENLETISSTLRKLLDDKRAEVQALGTGKLKSFIENYFPHIWDQGEKEVGQAVQKAAKRPFEGQKSFLKKRSIEFTSQGIEAGLTPVSYNPVDLALLKIREMDKYIMAHRTIDEYKKNGLAQYIKVGDDAPDGWQKIDDRISTIFKSPMVAVKEAFDAKVMSELNQVAENLGIDIERSSRMQGEGQKFKEAWGLSQSSAEAPGTPGKIWTKFAGPESALAHEIGHQIDHIYGFQDKFLSNPKIEKELTALANERVPQGAKQGFKDYVQEPGEKMAAMMEAYIHAPDLLKETAPTTFSQLFKILKSDPKLAPLTEIKPSLQLGVSEGQVYAGGNVIAGHIYAQPDAARIINNYLSPGLQKSSIYQAYRYAGNLINQFQLGFSAFHLGFTTLEASVSQTALAIKQLADGHPISAVKSALEIPFAPVTSIIRGDNLLKAWRGEGQNGSDDVLGTVMASAGGRARMDQFYATRAYDQMKHHFEAGNLVRGILHIPLSIIELFSKPILEYIVPRQKLGAFSAMVQMEMLNHPDISHQELREISQRAWDSVDNRMGQMVYDNLFWNRTFKDLLMASVRSVGWNLGTIRELAGGAGDYVEAISQATRGKKTEFSYRMAYFAALPIIVGTLGAMIQYLRTGKGPQEAKDYFFPKTGGVDEHGDAHRIALPSYMKDLYHYTEAPIQTVSNKLNPILAAMEQMMANKDYYGTKIRNEDDPLTKQVMSEAGFILKQVTPFSIRNMMKNQETGNKSLFDTVGPWVGITPAPYDIDQTKAEKLAHEIAMSHQEIGGRTEEQMERSRLVSDLTRRYKIGDPSATEDLYKSYEMGAISHHQMMEVVANARLTPLQRMIKSMTLEETERVYTKSNDEEKAQIEGVLERKRMNKEREFVAQ